ncbi:MAG: EAL domain-containing protein [Ignavibacteria bacterium]
MIAIRKHSLRRLAQQWRHVHRPVLPYDLSEGPRPNEDYRRLLGEVTMLRSRRVQIGIAIVLGDIDRPVCAEVQRAVGQLADYLSYASWGPLVVVAFQRCLFDQLKPMWQDLLVGAPGVCAGVAFPGEGMETHDLVVAARLALMRAIALHCDLVAFEDEESLAEVSRYRLACEMKRDLDRGGPGFHAHFQPQVRLSTGAPIGAEALARWQHAGDEVLPGRFIPIAEEAGLIGQIGEIMLGQSIHAVARLRDKGIGIPRVAVNVSPAQMHWNDFLRTAVELVRDEGLQPEDIELEITESIVGRSSQELLRWVADLSDAGFGIAIDDFGTGASTLARIREIPAGKIKLDRAFVMPLPDDVQGRKVCRSALRLADALGMTSLAEGVETRAQARFLKSSGCVQGQGHFWGRAMPIGELEQWWRERAGGAADAAVATPRETAAALA